MKESEILVVNGIPHLDYDELVLECVKYAILSLPFTVDRMGIPDESQRALNIAKGKIAERLFEYFCRKNSIEPDFERCSTPFWTVDKRDFILNGCEWDIKNNFIYHADRVLRNFRYSDLPALIPNRFSGDQWTKRDKKEFRESAGVHFLFTFLQNAELQDSVRRKEFLEIILSESQIDILRKLYKRYNGQPQEKQPFQDDQFWKEMDKKGGLSLYKLHSRPSLIITAYANSGSWHLFKDTGGKEPNNNFQDYLAPFWYQKMDTGALKFMSGTLWTKINNATLPIAKLPSFLSLFPHLKDNLNCAELL